MVETFGSRLKKGWNAFFSKTEDPFKPYPYDIGPSYGSRPDRQRLVFTSERSVVSSLYARMAIDISMIDVKHVRFDKENRYLEDVDSGLNECLTLTTNVDQTGTDFLADYAMTLFDEGVAAIVPVDTTADPVKTNSYDIKSMRVGAIRSWFPRHVTVYLYNDRTGNREEVTLPKENVAIVQNPLYTVMNEPNSTLKRLIAKLALLDFVDKQSSSGKLDIIIQLPYTIRSEKRQAQAEERRKAVEFQLKDSQYGIAYMDATERITQLNRPAENNLLAQIEGLTEQLYSQLGISKEVFDGTANELQMINYHNRTITPIIKALTDEMTRKFLTKTARTQGQRVHWYRDPFMYVPVEKLAEISDKFTRNEIMSSNEIRSVIGLKPDKDPKSDELRNSNLNQAAPEAEAPKEEPPEEENGEDEDGA